MFSIFIWCFLFCLFCFDPVRPTRAAYFTDETIQTKGHLILDSSFTLYVQADGTDPLTYTWFKDGDEIGDVSGDEFLINALAIGDTGNYQCVVTNKQGDDTTSLYILKFENSAPRWAHDTMYDSAFEGIPYTLMLPDSCNDPDSNTIHFSLEKRATVSDTIDSLQRYFFTPNFDDAGEYEIVFIANDRYHISRALLKLTVQNVNRLPVFDSLTPDTLYTINEGEQLTIPVSAMDPDSDTIHYHFEKTNFLRSASIELKNDTLLWQSIPGDSSAFYTITVCACDRQDTSKALVKVQVKDVDFKPVLDSLRDSTVNEGNTLSFPITAFDPDRDSITLVTNFIHSSAHLKDNGNGTGTFEWKTTYDDSGAHELFFIAKSTTHSDTTKVTISVIDKPHKWTINAGAGNGGTITPNGFIKVDHGSDTSFMISPNSGDYRIQDVKVNVKSRGPVSFYEFKNVKGDSTIYAEFIDNSAPVAVVRCKNSTVGLNDTINFFGSESSDPDGVIERYEWKIDNNNWAISTPDTNVIAPSIARAEYICSLKVTDNDKKSNVAMVSIAVISSPPLAVAKSNVTEIGLNDAFNIVGSESSDNGSIIQYEWKIGNENWIISTTGDTTIKAPSSAQTLICSLKVIDDDNEIGLAAVNIEVKSSPPVVVAKSDTIETGLNDTINLIGSESSDNGSLVQYEWKIGNRDWIISSTGDTTIIAPDAAQTLICSLRVTDDDNEIGLAAVSIEIKSSPPITVVKSNYPRVSINDTIKLSGLESSDNGDVIQYEWKINKGEWLLSSTGDTTFISPNTLQTLLCSLRVTDDDTEVSKTGIAIEVVSIPPIAVAKADTTKVSINDEIKLIGSESYDSNGVITTYEWKINNSDWTPSATGDTSFMGPSSIQTIVCSLCVTDDDNEISKAEIFVEVVKMPPIAIVKGNKDKVVKSGFVTLQSSDSYDNGTIVKYEWKIGNDAFIETSVNDTVIQSPSTEQTLMCALRVTDDDDEIGYGEVSIEVKPAFIYVGDTADFCKRDWHSFVVFNNKIWIIGGHMWISDSETMKLNDVWHSDDGKTWIMATGNATFSPRHGHASIVFQNKIWLIGGHDGQQYLNDVWYSKDGVTWVTATNSAGFSGRRQHDVLVFENKIWVIGGYNANNDIWSSPDGINWTQATNMAEFSNRNYHSSVVYNSKLWVIGGNDGQLKNDVWSSENGKYWFQVTDSADFSPRQYHKSVVYDNKMWVLGGGYKDVWYSENGTTWFIATNNAEFSASYHSPCFVFNNKIWLVFRNKIWYSSDAIIP